MSRWQTCEIPADVYVPDSSTQYDRREARIIEMSARGMLLSMPGGASRILRNCPRGMMVPIYLDVGIDHPGLNILGQVVHSTANCDNVHVWFPRERQDLLPHLSMVQRLSAWF